MSCAQQQAQQGGLAGPVGAQQRDLVAPLDDRGAGGDDGLVAVGEGQIFGFHDSVAGALRLAETQLRAALPLAALRPLASVLLQLADAALVAGAARLGASPGPRFLLRHLLVEHGPFFFLRLEQGFLADKEGVPVAGPVKELAPVELQDARGHAAEKGPVMGDEEQRHARGSQQVFHPVDGGDIEMVGGLVQQQRVRVGGQRAREQHPPLLPSGKGGEEGVRLQARQGNPAFGLKLGLPIAFGGVVFGAFGHDFRDGSLQIGGDVLGKIGDALAGGDDDFAAIGFLLPEQQAQQGGLARAVAARKADAFARFDHEGDLVEQGRAAHVKPQVAHSE